MNLTESMKYVFKNKGTNLLSDFWKEDLRSILREVKDDVTHAFNTSSDKKFRPNLSDWRDSAFDALTIIRHTPHRVKKGFAYFQEDFLKELENQKDSKEKAIFCLKVLGALTSFAISAAYGVRKARVDMYLPGIKNSRSAFTQFLLTELILKMSRLFIMRFISEVEKQISDVEELKKLDFFKKMLSENQKQDVDEVIEAMPGDKAFEIVESLKSYVMTGKKHDDITRKEI
jgi:hypothetical protein